MNFNSENKCSISYNGCGYEIGWDCEDLTYQTAPTLQRATHLTNH